MPSKLPQRVPETPPRESSTADGPNARPPRRTTVVYSYSTEGRVGGLTGALIGIVLLIALAAFVLLGAVALTLALWVALGAAVIGIVLALVRGAFGRGGGRHRGGGRQ